MAVAVFRRGALCYISITTLAEAILVADTVEGARPAAPQNQQLRLGSGLEFKSLMLGPRCFACLLFSSGEPANANPARDPTSAPLFRFVRSEIRSLKFLLKQRLNH